jgi:hypothetical protein
MPVTVDDVELTVGSRHYPDVRHDDDRANVFAHPARRRCENGGVTVAV